MTWEIILAIAGGIVLIANAGTAIYKWIRPAVNIKADVEQLKEHDRRDYEALNGMRALNKAQCHGMVSMMNHMIDGNHVDKMKETRDDLLELMSKI